MIIRTLTFVIAFLVALAVLPVDARSDSCWWHNGSLMRLEASGNQRWFTYERPKPELRRSGVQEGTLLFDGVRRGSRYIGTARVFSRYCLAHPLEYAVEGSVSRSDTRVVLRGTRDVQERCAPTGRVRTDTLVFDYAYDC
jgi:hypothetical protein